MTDAEIAAIAGGLTEQDQIAVASAVATDWDNRLWFKGADRLRIDTFAKAGLISAYDRDLEIAALSPLGLRVREYLKGQL